MEFSESQRHEIDEIYRKIADNEAITPNEALLFALWEKENAIIDAKFKAEQKQAEEDRAAKRAAFQAERDQAFKNMQELHNKAVERFNNIK